MRAWRKKGGKLRGTGKVCVSVCVCVCGGGEAFADSHKKSLSDLLQIVVHNYCFPFRFIWICVCTVVSLFMLFCSVLFCVNLCGIFMGRFLFYASAYIYKIVFYLRSSGRDLKFVFISIECILLFDYDAATPCQNRANLKRVGSIIFKL